MDHSITKKRKRRDAEAAAPTKTNGADKISKKSKKPKKPVSEDEEEVEEDDFEGFDEEENAEAEDEDVAAEDNADESDDKNEDDDDEEMNGADLPTDEAPVLPMATDAQSFDELKLSEKTMKAIQEMGFTKMTSIQKSVRLHTRPQQSSAASHY